MNQEPIDPPPLNGPEPDFENEEELTLVEDLRRLAAETREYAKAEIAFQKSRAVYAGAETRSILALAVGIAVCAFFAAMAFVVGLVFALAPLLTRWGAMAAVTLGLLLLAALCTLSVKKRIARLKDAIGGGRTD